MQKEKEELFDVDVDLSLSIDGEKVVNFQMDNQGCSLGIIFDKIPEPPKGTRQKYTFAFLQAVSVIMSDDEPTPDNPNNEKPIGYNL